MSFTQFSLHPRIMNGINALGYREPTPIQKIAIFPILAGRDVMGVAQTGTGKTAAFVLPLLHRLMQGPARHLRALIIAPTRELTEQTNNAVNQLGKKTRLISTSIYGGVGIQPQIRTLRKGVDVVSACPGRLLDHLQRRTADLSLIEILVLDEADRMFDMGFLPDIRRILGYLPQDRQTLMFSATMPKEVTVLAKDIMQDPVNLQVDRSAPADTVSHTFYPVKTAFKTRLLMKLLDTIDRGPVLVFTRTKLRSKMVTQKLFKSGHEAIALHGNLSQVKRQQALDGFRKGRYKILVATDVAARGLDVQGISHVINYDIPDTTEAYTHRIGRTGRACRTGDAFTFVTGEDKGAAHSICRLVGSKLKYCTVEGYSEEVHVQAQPYVKKEPKGKRIHRKRGAAFGTYRAKRNKDHPAGTARHRSKALSE